MVEREVGNRGVGTQSRALLTFDILEGTLI